VAERALVTGGAGFIGQFLCRRLLADGLDVYVVDNLSRHGLDAEVRELSRHVRLVDHDLARGLPDGLPGDFALVAHLAAWVGVGRIESEPYRALRDNVAMTMSVLDWCAGHHVGTVFLSSTSEIADGAAALGLASLPVPEDVPFVLPRPPAPRASYALSKLVAEALLLHAASARVRIGRYFNVYGPRMGTAHVVPQFIARILARASPFPVYGGEHTRAFCYISDAIEATMRLAVLPADEPVLANIGNDGEEIAMTELARRLFAVADYSAPLDVRGAPLGSPLRRMPDLGTLRRLTGYQPAVALDDGLALTYQWYARQAATAGRS
jgi:UDP-glucose 4-epimerase/UDP-glucuronate decarboxylase